ncbi:methionine adenosyltransferase [Rubrobacter xylanophilus DSM 9941]|uniref:S-adenosylmethionine synthase n=1 Tax=Rubrobacter xylanophilus (strain DSM 9941 / JCM 11954 / NBRC 16129 / PRD-1) TaxID=266117 RepID=Q1AVZ6_RUBXD|nr:methionine adenosyltransferase [Rubrobacter xylanophilus]ABG04432.1 methionine adenosyltransferase [Rubrobacter xylanophilus DSM 9941]
MAEKTAHTTAYNAADDQRLRASHLFTSESVTEGHPDKVADQISDAILDAALADDPMSRVACETLVTTGLVMVAGEITTSTYVDIPSVVRKKISEIGYTRAKYGFDAETCGVITSIDPQSPDIAQGVDRALEVRDLEEVIDEIGAGDQGMMFGYACEETPELMPLPITLAHALTRRLSEVRKSGELDYLRPDGKSQVTVRYEGDRPVSVEKVLVSAQHRDGMEKKIREDIIEAVIRPVMPEEFFDEKRAEILVNPTGRFVLGGPQGDTGLTGRKIIVDTYGGAAPHGGGAFSGKDATKVDRSGSYAARWVAKNVVASGLARRCLIQVAYAIGVARPVSVMVETFGTARVDPARIGELIRDHFDLRPGAIIRDLDLRRPVFSRTAAYGHFGRREPGFTWEETNRAEELRRAAGL